MDALIAASPVDTQQTFAELAAVLPNNCLVGHRLAMVVDPHDMAVVVDQAMVSLRVALLLNIESVVVQYRRHASFVPHTVLTGNVGAGAIVDTLIEHLALTLVMGDQ